MRRLFLMTPLLILASLFPSRYDRLVGFLRLQVSSVADVSYASITSIYYILCVGISVIKP